MTSGKIRHFVAAAAVLLGLDAGAVRAAEAGQMRIVLEPGEIDSAAGTASVAVTMSLPALESPRELAFSHQNGAPGMQGGIPILAPTLRDSSGPVALISATDAERRPIWKTARAIEGAATLHYTVSIDNKRGGILTSIPSVDGEGVFGIGNMLLLLPQVAGDYPISVAWDLSRMPPGSEATSNFGDGDINLPAGPVNRLQYAMFMAGKLKRQPEARGPGFAAVWTGEPQFDVRGAMQWSELLYHWMSRFFRDPEEPLYRVFLRRNEFNPGNGVAAPHAFALGYGSATTAEGAKTILGHEMTHTWTTTDGLGKWYTEGMAVYYQSRLPWQAGLIPIDQYLRDINLTAARYYANTAIGAPDSEILPNFWSDRRLTVLPYDRGAIYFAMLNGRMMRASGGRKSVDDLVRMMVDRARKGERVTEETWIRLLSDALGEAGPALHRAMLAGQVLAPESGDFGPCFRRVATRIRRYDLGFGGPGLKAYKVVEGLKAGSEAAKAGLREGDQIDYRTSTEGAQRDPNMPLTMKVTREGRSFTISYLPRGEPVDAFQWQRVPNVPENSCR